MSTALDSHTVTTGQPSVALMVWRLTRHHNQSFWRTPIAAFFTLAFPLTFLVLFSSLFGNELIPGTSVRFAQFFVPSIAVLAAVTASLTSLAISLTIDREDGILKRMRGTPAPPWLIMSARIVSMLWISIMATLIMVAVGVVAFDVQIVGAKLPAAIVTLVVGILSFCSLGVVVAALSPSNEATSAIANGMVIPLSFISEIFVIDADLPRWLDIVGWLFPLKHFAVALQDTFNPFTDGAGFSPDHLGAMALWGTGGLAIALWRFQWESPPGRTSRRPGAPDTNPDRVTTTAVPAGAAPARALPATPIVDSGSSSTGRLILTQIHYGVLAFVRTRASAFFTLFFPPLLLALFFFVFGNPTLDERGGITLAQFAAPALGVYGVAVATYADFSERVAFMRDKGILKRVRGTPLPAWAFIVGRMGATVVVALASLTITMAVGMIFFDAQVVPRMLVGVIVTVTLGISTFTALGLALAAVVPRAASVPTIANATLLPIAFFSDVFLIGDPPAWVATVGSIFPLKHFVNAVADGFNPTVAGAGFFVDHLAVMAVWGVVAMALALRFFTWQPRAADGSGV